jgi:peptide/nickel transport system permease protein
LRRATLIRRHVILNALPPIVTITGLQLGYLLGGALLTEVVFAWPGLGSLLYDSITARDLPVLQATTLVIALAFVLANIVVDTINAALDPRLRGA